ncbi:MAG: DUF2807 domain-containing protein [Candidatus Melainabacteria bacterium]|nr:DUF2807 domain-containing protein [Candidatus Melainabacteria bacterium]
MKSKKAHQTILTMFVLCACFSLNSACSIDNKPAENKALKTETRSVDSFSSILIDGSCILDISVQEACSLSVTTEPNALAKIKTDVKDGTLQIAFDNVRVASAPRITVGLPAIDGVDISGACNSTMNDVKSKSLKISIDGASKLQCSGSCDDLSADLSGASELNAEKLICKQSTLSIDGASKARVFVKDSFKVDASGASRIELLGNPPQVTKNISGAASLLQGGESSD